MEIRCAKTVTEGKHYARSFLSLFPACRAAFNSYVAFRIYRVIHSSLRDFRTRLLNNRDRHGRKEHINR